MYKYMRKMQMSDIWKDGELTILEFSHTEVYSPAKNVNVMCQSMT